MWLLVMFSVVMTVTAALYPRTAQPQSYHHFADQRAWLGIPNFGDVVSNLLFAVAGTWGLIFLSSRNGAAGFIDSSERWAYVAVFFGLLLTAFGSGYYHLAPDNGRLVWDRLPMTIAFMGLVVAMYSERISVDHGLRLLPFFLLVGASSVVWWWYTESIGAGDLRFYAALQVYAVLALPIFLLIPARYTRSADLAVVFGLYVLAKICETADRGIFSLTKGTISGHTLKHLAAGAAGFWILRMLKKREPAPHIPIDSEKMAG